MKLTVHHDNFTQKSDYFDTTTGLFKFRCNKLSEHFIRIIRGIRMDSGIRIGWRTESDPNIRMLSESTNIRIIEIPLQ